MERGRRMLGPRSLPRTLRGVGGARLIDMPGVRYPEEILTGRKGTDSRSGLPHASPPHWGVSTREAAGMLGISERATRALLTRHKSNYCLVTRPGRCACMYWDRSVVERVLAKRVPMVCKEPEKLCSVGEACMLLVISRSSLSRYVKRGFLKEYRVRHATESGVRMQSFYLRAEVRQLAARRHAAQVRAEEQRREQIMRYWNGRIG